MQPIEPAPTLRSRVHFSRWGATVMIQITACFSEAMPVCLYGIIIKKSRSKPNRKTGPNVHLASHSMPVSIAQDFSKKPKKQGIYKATIFPQHPFRSQSLPTQRFPSLVLNLYSQPNCEYWCLLVFSILSIMKLILRQNATGNSMKQHFLHLFQM